jgi:predicted acyl esterase
MAALEPHPALRAISPQASPADMWLGDDFHHNGAFRLSYGFEYAARMETSKEQAPFEFDRYDTYDWYLSLGPLSRVNAEILKGNIPNWNDYVAQMSSRRWSIAKRRRRTAAPRAPRPKPPRHGGPSASMRRRARCFDSRR